MIGKLILLFSWVFYAGLFYTFFVPEHLYLNYLDNARTLYLWLHIPIQLLMTFVLLVIGLLKGKLSEEIPNVVAKMQKDGKDVLKFEAEYKKFTGFSNQLFMSINRLYYIATATLVFIGMGDTFLGVVMFWGIISGLLLMNLIGAILKEMKNALS